MQNPGQLRVHSRGLVWKKQGGGKAVEVDKSDIVRITWMKVPRSNQLGVQIKDGLKYKFTGFRDQVSFSMLPYCIFSMMLAEFHELILYTCNNLLLLCLQDVPSLTNFFQNSCGITPEEKQLSVSGKNWGELDING